MCLRITNTLELESTCPGAVKKPKGKVVCRVTNEMGHLKLRYNPNPIIDTSEYCVEFGGGSTEEYAADLIADNIFAQADDKGRDHLLLDEMLVVHRTTDVALTMENCWLSSANGQKRMRPTTKG